jgi:hypothetical protein
VADMRAAIAAGTFERLRRAVREAYATAEREAVPVSADAATEEDRS